MNAQVVVRLIVYIDQALMRHAITSSYTGISKIEEVVSRLKSFFYILFVLRAFSSLFIFYFWKNDIDLTLQEDGRIKLKISYSPYSGHLAFCINTLSACTFLW